MPKSSKKDKENSVEENPAPVVITLSPKKINKEATDQAKVLALHADNGTDVAPFSYSLFEYHDQSHEQIQQADRTRSRRPR